MNRTFLLICLLFFGCSKDSEKLKMLFAGDLMFDRGTRDIIEDNNADYLFTDVKNLFSSSDITVANFECVACDTTLKPINKKFTFRANPEWLSSLHNNGITHVTLTNNHSFDFGEEGVKQTATNLKHYQINFIGYNPNNNLSCFPTIIEKKENTIAVFSSCFLKQNNSLICSENTYTLSERIRVFKVTHPSYLVFVCLHWGIEMELKPTSKQIEQAHLLINSGADAIIGHHPHVVQTIELFKGKYIFYSIGNFIFDNNNSPANQGIFASFSFSKGVIEPVRIIPFNIVKSKPKPMDVKESEKFMNEISSVSPTLNFKQSDASWKAL